MIRTTTRGIALAFACPALIPADATAQYWSLGISIGGGTIAAIHGGMHLGDTDERRGTPDWRRRGISVPRGRTEIELVIGFRSLRTGRQQNRASPTLGLNVRRTKESGLSAGLGFRFAPAPSDRVGGYHTAFHLPIGLEVYPLPARLFVYPGLGKHAPPPGGNGPPSKWRFFLPRPQLQIYLKHTGGFHYT